MTPTTTPAAQRLIDKLANAAETNRLRSDWYEELDQEPFNRLTEWAESLQEVAEAVETARDALEPWSCAEGRKDKADAKDEALEALDALVTAWTDSPLDLATLADYEPPEDEDA